jgi:hypothetical protein
LYFPMAVSIFSSGSAPDSVSARTSIMNRIVVLPLGV